VKKSNYQLTIIPRLCRSIRTCVLGDQKILGKPERAEKVELEPGSNCSTNNNEATATIRRSELQSLLTENKKVKAFPYSIPSTGPGGDPGVQAVSPKVTVSHPPGGRLPLLSARPAVTFPAAKHHHPLASTKLYCLVTEAHRCKQLAQGCYTALPGVGFEPTTY